MSRTPNSRKHETHERIVEVAARAIRRDGYAGVGVADVMKQAGLTHGGFYAHFDSRDALIVEALERAGQESSETVGRAVARRAAKGVSPFRALVEAYLSDDHLASLETGCNRGRTRNAEEHDLPVVRQGCRGRRPLLR